MCTKISFLVLLTFITLIYSDNGSESEGTFLYFAYGSNLLARRLHINNPSAVFHSVAKLKDYRLDFNIYDDLWGGAVATIVEDPGQTVWGALWTLNTRDMKHLDTQEITEGWYFAKNVTVTSLQGTNLVARTYQEVHNPPKLPEGGILPDERRPSNTYLEVIIVGAVELKLPSEYISYLRTFPTNGQQANRELRNKLGFPFNATV